MSDDQAEPKESAATEVATDTNKTSPTITKKEAKSSSTSDSAEKGDDKSANDSLRDEGPAAEAAGSKIEIKVNSENEGGEGGEDGDNPTKESSSSSSSTKKISQADWPLYDLKEYHANDVLYGRGGGTNHHPGNKRYRKMVDQRKADYISSKRLDKPLVALEIIKEWRSQNPPGRFLKLDEKTGLWNDVGDKKAREKTSQALREKAPAVKKEDKEKGGEKGESGDDSDSNKSEDDGSPTRAEKQTRFDVPKASPLTEAEKRIKANKRLVLRRDHSLGQDYIREDEAMTLKGFSWNDPVENIFGNGGNGSMRSVSGGSASSGPRRVSDPGSYMPSRRKGWDSAFQGPRSDSLPVGMSPSSLQQRNSIAGDTDFGSMKPRDSSIGRRQHSLSKNPLSGGNVNIPALNPFADDDRPVERPWGAPPPYVSRNGRERSPPLRQSPPSRLPNNDEGSSAFSRPNEGSAFMRTNSGGRGFPRQMRSSSNSSITMEESGQQRFVRGSSIQSQQSQQGKGYQDQRELLTRQSSSMSDDYMRVADMMGDELAPLHHSWSAQSDDYSMRNHAPRVDNGGGGFGRGPQYSPENVPPAGDIFQQSAPYSPPTPTQSVQPGGPPGNDYNNRVDFGVGGYAPSSPSKHREYDTERRRSDGYDQNRQGGARYSSFSSTNAPPSPGRKQSLRSIGKGARPNVKKPSLIRKLSGGSVPQSPPCANERKRITSLPKPNAIKRNTSNQNETAETKMKGIKRAVLSRDHSLASRALKESMESDALRPSSVFNEDAEEEMERLGTTFGKSKLNDTPRNSTTFSGNFRGVEKPGSLKRTSTIEAVHEAFREGFAEKPGPIVRNSTIDRVADELLAAETTPVDPIGKPAPLSRTSTIDAIARDMVLRERGGAQTSSIENLDLVDGLEDDPFMGSGVPPENQTSRELESDVNQITDDWFERCDLIE